MVTDLLYMQHPEILDFQANLLDIEEQANDLFAVRLDRSYFYPTGGGQEHDTGWINDARVLNVLKDEKQSPGILHWIDRPLVPGPVSARIDADRRFRHMQHHTAQHLLTQCFLQSLGLETTSANINGFSPSTLDLPVTTLDSSRLDEVERFANQVIFENRFVRAFFAAPDELVQFPLRKQPPVSTAIRIVEIAGFDWSPCAGTHCNATGQVGILKITRTERVRDNLRIHFVAGLQAYEIFASTYAITSALSSQFSLHPGNLVQAMSNQADQLKQAQKEILDLRKKFLAAEARSLAEEARNGNAYPRLIRFFEGRPALEIRFLAEELAKVYPGLSCLFTHDGQALTACFSSSKDCQLSARQELARWLSSVGGKGGGDDRFAQGGAKMTGEVYRALSQQSLGWI